MEDQDLFHIMNDSHTSTNFPLPQRLIEEYEEMDVLVVKLMYKPEEQCRKLHISIIIWSPAYQKSSLVLEYWIKRKSHSYNELRNIRQMIVL